MDRLIFTLALIGGLFVSLLAIVAGIWVNPRKELPDWIMAVSSLFLLTGFSGLSIILIKNQFHVMRWLPEETWWDFTFLSLFLSAALFSTGFLWHRLRRCRLPGR